ncbi:MAG: endoglucanase [Nitrospinae bacterium]|nr:endoglucanase [Nitrospinota bacterium]MBF0635466.1 endoglucanase [Nitrospinota bacterium]
MSRLVKLLPMAVVMTIALSGAAYGGEKEKWESYKSAFLSRDGRIVDFHQDSCSHSEGQGYGLLLAVAFGDREAFDRMWAWTKSNLRVRTDGLFAWKWGKRLDGRWEIIDHNNATDGDLLIALALLKAADKWGSQAYAKEALPIVQSIRKNLVANWQGRLLLLPSYYGFIKKETLVFNPSYLILPAFRAFAKVDDKTYWDKVWGDSAHFISQSLFGLYGLPADWALATEKGVKLHSEKSVYFGYDAIRVLLHLAGEGGAEAYPKGVREALRLYGQLGYVPTWLDLDRDAIAMSSATAGVYAIYGLTAKRVGQTALAEKLFKEADEKLSKEKENYYSFSLYLLVASEAFFK